VKILLKLVDRLRPDQADQADQIIARTARLLLGKLTVDFTVHRLVALAELTERLPPAEAARAAQLLIRLRMEASKDLLYYLPPMLGSLVKRVPPAEAASLAPRAASLILEVSTGLDEATGNRVIRSLAMLADRCGEQDLIELLKHPCCVGAEREVILAALARRLGQDFATRWELAAWVKRHRPDLDLASPPRRVEP
jgi:hypothetical protein